MAVAVTLRYMLSVLLKLRIRGKFPVPSCPVFRKSIVWGGGKALLVRGPGLGKSVLSGQEPCQRCFVCPLAHNWPFITISHVDKRRYVSQLSMTVTKHLC